MLATKYLNNFQCHDFNLSIAFHFLILQENHTFVRKGIHFQQGWSVMELHNVRMSQTKKTANVLETKPVSMVLVLAPETNPLLTTHVPAQGTKSW